MQSDTIHTTTSRAIRSSGTREHPVTILGGTKAETLRSLKGSVSKCRILEQVSFTLEDWNKGRDEVLTHIRRTLGSKALAVRSSAQYEDGFASSFAGAYSSVLDIDGRSESALTAAIVRVIASYPDSRCQHQVLVQPMLQNVQLNGVVLTRTLDEGAPYYVINYDDTTGGTTSVTSGTCQVHKTLVVHRDSAEESHEPARPLDSLLSAVQEIESFLNSDSLDMEFAIDTNGHVYMLQVRPMTTILRDHRQLDSDVATHIKQMKEQFRRLQKPPPFTLGRRSGFGVMPDWNPAEIIGIRPGALALSLYRYLLMDTTWATQRAEYGYRNVHAQPLLTEFCGHPYVDIRSSFNSFLPAAIDDDLGTRLVDYYITRLERNPHLHDKVEFDVVPTCYTLEFTDWRERLEEEGDFAPMEIDRLGDGLRVITHNAFLRNSGDLAAVETAQRRCTEIIDQVPAPLERALALLDDCRNFGAIVFAHLARSAFVAIALLRSAVRTRVISQAAMHSFMGSLRTISRRMSDDLIGICIGKLERDTFIARYGHLRPGTYEITSQSYFEMADDLIPRTTDRMTARKPADISNYAWESEREAFGKALKKAGLSADLAVIEKFMREAIEGREYAKFALSRNISGALDALSEFGMRHGMTRESLSHVSIRDIMALHENGMSVGENFDRLSYSAREGARKLRMAYAIELPALIFSERDFTYFSCDADQPNFVGNKHILAKCVSVDHDSALSVIRLGGKIVLLSRADPGFDWLFGSSIAGLITQYGGANSHMTIRAAEHGIPAAIGVGPTLYRKLTTARVLELNARTRQIQVVA